MRPELSIIICTYRRADLLAYCLEALRGQSAARPWELLVIDNNSPDDTPELVARFLGDNPEISGRRVLETQQGLSHARNRGYAEAAADWVLYLDDDAKAAPDFVERAFWLLEHTDYKVIGGVYHPWYHFGRPDWYRDEYGSNARPETELCVPNHNYFATGGVMIWEKALLADLGGFDPNIGMVGDKIAYGEESYLQFLVRDRGLEVAYDPKLVIHHVVMEQKLHVDWFFKSYFAAGRDAVVSGHLKPGLATVLSQFFVGWLVMTKDFILSTPKLLGKNYHVENWLIDVFRKMAKRIGSIYTLLLTRPET